MVTVNPNGARVMDGSEAELEAAHLLSGLAQTKSQRDGTKGTIPLEALSDHVQVYKTLGVDELVGELVNRGWFAYPKNVAKEMGWDMALLLPLTDSVPPVPPSPWHPKLTSDVLGRTYLADAAASPDGQTIVSIASLCALLRAGAPRQSNSRNHVDEAEPVVASPQVPNAREDYGDDRLKQGLAALLTPQVPTPGMMAAGGWVMPGGLAIALPQQGAYAHGQDLQGGQPIMVNQADGMTRIIMTNIGPQLVSTPAALALQGGQMAMLNGATVLTEDVTQVTLQGASNGLPLHMARGSAANSTRRRASLPPGPPMMPYGSRNPRENSRPRSITVGIPGRSASLPMIGSRNDENLHRVLRMGWQPLVDVVCNNLTGKFLGGHDKDLYIQCTGREYVNLPLVDVKEGGCIMTCAQFEKRAGRELSKKWKESIHVTGDAEGSRATLITWLRRQAARHFGEAVINKTCWVRWCSDGEFYQATIIGYNMDTGKHKVRYMESLYIEELHLPVELLFWTEKKPTMADLAKRVNQSFAVDEGDAQELVGKQLSDLPKRVPLVVKAEQQPQASQEAREVRHKFPRVSGPDDSDVRTAGRVSDANDRKSRRRDAKLASEEDTHSNSSLTEDGSPPSKQPKLAPERSRQPSEEGASERDETGTVGQKQQPASGVRQVEPEPLVTGGAVAASQQGSMEIGMNAGGGVKLVSFPNGRTAYAMTFQDLMQMCQENPGMQAALPNGLAALAAAQGAGGAGTAPDGNTLVQLPAGIALAPGMATSGPGGMAVRPVIMGGATGLPYTDAEVQVLRGRQDLGHGAAAGSDPTSGLEMSQGMARNRGMDQTAGAKVAIMGGPGQAAAMHAGGSAGGSAHTVLGGLEIGPQLQMQLQQMGVTPGSVVQLPNGRTAIMTSEGLLMQGPSTNVALQQQQLAQAAAANRQEHQQHQQHHPQQQQVQQPTLMPMPNNTAGQQVAQEQAAGAMPPLSLAIPPDFAVTAPPSKSLDEPVEVSAMFKWLMSVSSELDDLLLALQAAAGSQLLPLPFSAASRFQTMVVYARGDPEELSAFYYMLLLKYTCRQYAHPGEQAKVLAEAILSAVFQSTFVPNKKNQARGGEQGDRQSSEQPAAVPKDVSSVLEAVAKPAAVPAPAAAPAVSSQQATEGGSAEQVEASPSQQPQQGCSTHDH